MNFDDEMDLPPERNQDEPQNPSYSLEINHDQILNKEQELLNKAKDLEKEM